MKNILYVSANGFIGGAEKVLLNLAQMHRERGEDVCFLLFNDGVLKDELLKLNVNTHVLKNKFRLSSPKSLFKAVLEIRSLVREHNFSIIHSTMAYCQLVMGLSLLFMKNRRVWFQHGPVGGFLDFLASAFPVDIIIFNSHYLLQKHMGTVNFHKGKKSPRIISLPVDLKTPSPLEVLKLKEMLNIENKFVIGSFGRIARGKNYELIIKGFSKLNYDDAVLIIMGSPTTSLDQVYYIELKKLAKDLNIEEKIIFLQYQSQISSYYKVLSLYIHAGIIDEGFGLTVAEAMFCGVPVISSPYGALANIVSHKETAYVVYTRDSMAESALEKQINFVRNNRDEVALITKKAQEMIQLNHSQKNFYEGISSVYHSLNSID